MKAETKECILMTRKDEEDRILMEVLSYLTRIERDYEGAPEAREALRRFVDGEAKSEIPIIVAAQFLLENRMYENYAKLERVLEGKVKPRLVVI